jgi:hypothetical protein
MEAAVLFCTRVSWLFFFVVVFFAVGFFFYVFDVPAVVLRGEGDAVAGVGDGAHAVGGNVEVLRVRRGDLQAVEKEAGAFRVELIGGEGLKDVDEGELDGFGVLDRRELQWETLCSASVSRVAPTG